jgi:Rrf2 family nitric oxide-sensitive transcriptional repressor
MRLTQFTDNAVRCLIHLGLHDDMHPPIGEIARAMEISEEHLGKVVQRLARLGYVQTVRGRTGGVHLARRPAEINMGRLVREMEEDFPLVSCFTDEHPGCPIAPACTFASVLDEALAAFFRVLDARTLADALEPHRRLHRALHQAAKRRAEALPPS